MILNMNHEMTFSFLCDICFPCYALHLALRHGLNFRTQRISCFHSDEDIVWNVISSNITNAQTTRTQHFSLREEGV